MFYHDGLRTININLEYHQQKNSNFFLISEACSGKAPRKKTAQYTAQISIVYIMNPTL